MFRIATLFSVVLVGFLVKHADGVRDPAQASMIEREVTSWGKDPCAKFGAKRRTHSKDSCECPKDRPETTKACGGLGHDLFRLSKASSGCRCVTEAELREAELPVSASALRFCEALVEHSWEAQLRGETWIDVLKDAVEETSPETCQHALVGTISKTEGKKAPWAEEASEFSQHGGDEEDEDEDQEDQAYGRMQPVKKDATTSEEKALWEHALAQVCKDECKDLLHMMKWQAWKLVDHEFVYHVPFAQTCAERVVKQVEAEVLGCCARTCGFNGRTCLLWPFFFLEEKVEWEVECCAEISVLKNSSREVMCNSVLSSHLAQEASKYDLKEENGTDVGKVLIGQNSSLFWTEKGAQKARDGIKVQLPKKSTKAWSRRFISKLLHPLGKSVLIKEKGARADTKVSMDFLLKHPNVGEEFLRRGFFREEPFSKVFDGGASSMMEVNLQDGTACDFGKLRQQCPKTFHETYMKTCKESWKVTQVSEESEDSEETNFRDLAFGPEEGDCDESTSQSFATPEECESLTTNSFGEIFVHYFTYNTENKEKPITCFTLSKQQCKGKDQWWTMIPLVSVQELVKEEDVNTYTELVYVRVTISHNTLFFLRHLFVRHSEPFGSI